MPWKSKYKVGDIVDTKNGKVKILEYLKGRKLLNGRRTQPRVTVQFIDSGWKCNVDICALKRGEIKDRLARTIYGVGYFGADIHISRDTTSIPSRAYRVWYKMLERCYSGDKHWKSYEDCTVSERWQCFKNFYDDLPKLEGYDRWLRGEDMHLDKDIKVKGNRVYSLETCMFVTAFENHSECQKRRWRKQNEAANTEN